MTYAEKLVAWRGELAHMVGELLESDDPEPAEKLLGAALLIKRAHEQLADLGLDECDWKDPT